MTAFLFLMLAGSTENEDSQTDDEAPKTAPPPESPEDSARKALRAINSLRQLNESEEGIAVEQAPNGIYAFTSSPVGAAPMFRQKIFRGFELHKHLDSAIHVIGFVTDKQAAQISKGEACLDIEVYPDPIGEADKLISIPRSRIARAKGPSRDAGNALKLDVAPVTEAVN